MSTASQSRSTRPSSTSTTLINKQTTKTTFQSTTSLQSTAKPLPSINMQITAVIIATLLGLAAAAPVADPLDGLVATPNGRLMKRTDCDLKYGALSSHSM